MNQQPYITDPEVQQVTSAARAKAFLNKVYMWLAGSMLLTAGVAAYTAQDMNSLLWVAEHSLLLCLSTLGLVVIMSFAVNKLSAGTLAILLLVFAALQGLLFGPLLICYGLNSVGKAFGCTAVMFGGMSIYGTITKRNLSTMGRTIFMLLIGLIAALIINLFWGNGIFDTIICCAGVLIFAAFTAYHTQNLLKIGLSNDPSIKQKGAILGALSLYLDFINLFIFLLRLIGRDE